MDKRIIVCLKPAGVLSTDEPGGLPELLRRELGDEKACVKTVHRLDAAVGGVMVLARSHEAARILSRQVEERSFSKQYLAVINGAMPEKRGTLRDLLGRDKARRLTYIASESGKDVREAVLDYEALEEAEGLSLMKITLHTGRTHQIRAQFSGRSCPLFGDRKYGAPEGQEGVALWSCSIGFTHPQTGERMSFTAPPPECEPWSIFQNS